jgi:hypothetical protein
MHVFIDLVAVACSGRLCRQTPLGNSRLEIAGSGGIRSCAPIFFLWPFGFRGSASKICWLLISWDMFSFHSNGGECHGDRDLRTSRRLFECGWWWGIGLAVRDMVQRYASGATTQEEFRVLPCGVKIQGLTLIGCVWQWPCWRHCFVSEDFLQGENPWSMIERRWCLCTVFFLEGVVFGEAELLVLSWWWLYCCYKE